MIMFQKTPTFNLLYVETIGSSVTTATAQNYSERIDCIIALFTTTILSEELKIETVKKCEIDF